MRYYIALAVHAFKYYVYECLRNFCDCKKRPSTGEHLLYLAQNSKLLKYLMPLKAPLEIGEELSSTYLISKTWIRMIPM